MWKLNVAECFCALVVGEECPITGVHIFFWSQLLHCVMWFRIEDIGLGLGFGDQFKENDERSRGFMSGLSGRSFYVVGVWSSWEKESDPLCLEESTYPAVGTLEGKWNFEDVHGYYGKNLLVCPTPLCFSVQLIRMKGLVGICLSSSIWESFQHVWTIA